MKVNVNVKLSASKSLIRLVQILAMALTGADASKLFKSESEELDSGEPALKENLRQISEPIANQTLVSQGLDSSSDKTNQIKKGTRDRTKKESDKVLGQQGSEKTIASETAKAEELAGEPEPTEQPDPKAVVESQSGASEGTKLDYTFLREVTQKLYGDSQEKKLKTKKLLTEEFGVPNLTSLPEEKFAYYYTRIQEVLK